MTTLRSVIMLCSLLLLGVACGARPTTTRTSSAGEREARDAIETHASALRACRRGDLIACMAAENDPCRGPHRPVVVVPPMPSVEAGLHEPTPPAFVFDGQHCRPRTAATSDACGGVMLCATWTTREACLASRELCVRRP